MLVKDLITVLQQMPQESKCFVYNPIDGPCTSIKVDAMTLNMEFIKKTNIMGCGGPKTPEFEEFQLKHMLEEYGVEDNSTVVIIEQD